MKIRNPKIGLSKLCWFLGVTRQAYYQSFQKEELVSIEQELALKEVLKIRNNHPRIGTRKLYLMMQDFMLEHQIKMGRDALFDLLCENQLLIRRRKRKITTTQSHHWMKKHPNLIKNFVATEPNQLYVSDITYWKTSFGNAYISLITDAYSHKIVGYNVAENMEAVESIKALKMALNAIDKEHNLIHHSDRGSQYCCGKYVKLLQDYGAKISMTETGDPLDNAVAERINGILKEEYLECYIVPNFQQAKKLLEAVVKLYNNERPHMSIGNLVPEKVHNESIKTERKWKNYYQKQSV